MKSLNWSLTVLMLSFFLWGANAFSGSLFTEKDLAGINTDGDELSAAMSSDGQTLVFSRKEKGKKDSDLYIMEYKNGAWTKPAPSVELNSDSDDATPFLAQDGNFIIFSSDRAGSLKHSSADKPSYDIYFSEKENGRWGKPALLFGAVNTTDDELNPSLSKDGKYIYFTRRRFNNSKSLKIVRVEKSEDFWGEVKTAALPSGEYEAPLFYRESYMKTGFYMAASPKKKQGANDIFFIPSGSEEKAVNAGKNLNTENDEISICEIDDSTVLVASGTRGTEGSYDFYIKKLPDTVKNSTMTGINLTLLNTEKFQGRDMSVKFLLFTGKKPGPDPAKTVKMKPDSAGKIKLVTGSGVKRVVAIPGSSAMKDFVKEFILKENQIVKSEISLQAGEESDFTIRPVYFGFNSSKIRLRDIPYMHRLVDYLRKNRSVKLYIKGYADGTGSYRANIHISIRRAEAVKTYLTGMGLDRSRFKVKGMGHRKDRGSHTDQYNRRAEITEFR